MKLSIRHDPGFGIAALMPHAALAQDLCAALPDRRGRARTDPVPSWTRLDSDHGARYLGSNQRIRCAVNDHIGIEPDFESGSPPQM
jgi:hypothetical protein